MMKKSILVALLCGVVLSGCSGQDEPSEVDESGLPRLNIDPLRVTVSGLSSGAYMAQQFHFAHSERVRGAALVAGGPYDCAQGSLATALSQCMGNGTNPPDSEQLLALIRQRAEQRTIQPLENLRQDQVWLFRGERDNTVGDAIFNRAHDIYQQFVEPANIEQITRAETGHLWPTLTSGGDCAGSESPYLGNCNYDAAGELLAALYGYLHEPGSGERALVTFDQQMAGGRFADSLADEGYLYVPEECAQGQACSLHISFHGCNQHSAAVGDRFARESGLNRWADSNRLVILYPQVRPSTTEPMNPQGCWDWWGYTGADYATLDGLQIEAVLKMINRMAGVDVNTDVDMHADTETGAPEN
ncbi:polyhydroxybutyrate depolymerase [Aliidiomarina sedimenti]|uniref:Polyhydroxybutyrate depolymerase n=2 Tax=Aliidiomarina sedimenti TaxID=1933879 RepID=A0ABY0BUT3_9GAMM|nr:polyhydroxybutyrate depolymerase [Aliidiomarina sedimenti]